MIDAIKIDWDMINKIEDPKQKKFFQNVKNNIEAGKEINPDGLIEQIGVLMGGENTEMQEKLVKLNDDFKMITSGLDKFKM